MSNYGSFLFITLAAFLITFAIAAVIVISFAV